MVKGVSERCKTWFTVVSHLFKLLQPFLPSDEYEIYIIILLYNNIGQDCHVHIVRIIGQCCNLDLL